MTNQTAHRSQLLTVKDEWIDFNGHLNMAYYNVLFDVALDDVFESFGLGPDYVARTNSSSFSLQAQVSYLAELRTGDEVYVTNHLIDFDHKRTHFYQELYHAKKGYLSATCELLSMHVDTVKKRSSPFPPEMLEKIAAMADTHKDIDRAPRIGQSIGIRRS